MQNETVKAMFLEAVWCALSEKQWRSTNEIQAEAGVDDSSLMRMVNFLVRWDFAEIRHTPSPHVRRKAGAMSPVDVLNVLSTVDENPEATIPEPGFRLAERVACARCGGRKLRAVGENLVECTKCSERQWWAIERQPGTMERELSNIEAPLRRTYPLFP